jgi:hypothetical protein
VGADRPPPTPPGGHNGDQAQHHHRAGPGRGFWTSSVQVYITATDGTPVTDIETAQGILSDLFTPGRPYTEDIDSNDDGVFLLSVPAELYQEASEEGGAVVSHSGGTS